MKLNLSSDPAIPFLEIYPRETLPQVYRMTYRIVLMAAMSVMKTSLETA